jgi:hypothetical protein
MKMLCLLLGCLLAIGISAVAADSSGAKKGKLRHVVAFKFKETASKEDIKKVEEAFAGLKNKIPTIVGYEWGMNNSPEKLNRGCTHGFILTFNSEKDRDEYLVHPAHKDFGKLVGPLLDEVFVIDFWAHE